MPLYATNTSARVCARLQEFFKSHVQAAMQQAHAKSVVSTVEREAWPTLITQSLETPEEEMFADTNGISPTIQ
jgi:hypothetical protein